MKAGKRKAGRVTVEIFSITRRLPQWGRKEKGRGADFWGDIRNVGKTDKEASLELVGVGMSVSFRVQGMYEPVCTQGRAKVIGEAARWKFIALIFVASSYKS